VADAARFPQVRGSRPRPLNRATDTVYEQFLAEYQVEYDVGIADQIFTPNSYDAAWMLAAGAAWAHFQEGGEITGVNIARGLRKLSSGPAVVISPGGWPTLRSNFQQGISVNLNGASGPVDFDPATEETESPIQIWTIDANLAPQEVDVWFPPQE
jgi:branched-chain amino acid transport system substrate-binding protein